MTWIDDHKGAGPWPFVPQPDKPHYNEGDLISDHDNPVWKMDFLDTPINSDDRVTPVHHPWCGYWTKDYVPPVPSLSIGSHYWNQQSIDIIPDKICMIPMYYDESDQAGILNVVYRDGEWVSHGIVRGMHVIYGEPNTCRITSVYEAYYCSCMDWNWNEAPEKYKFYLRLYVFEKGKEIRHTTVWESNWSTNIPYYASDYVIHNVMDCVGDRIACIARILKVDNVTFNKYQIKVSNDAGLTFSTEWSFPTVLSSGGGDYVQLRMSQDGIVWVAYLRHNSHAVEIWKSNPEATSWSKVGEFDYSAYLNGTRCWGHWTFDISDADGQYMSIRLQGGSSGGIYYRVTYSSSDYGVSFTAHVNDSSDYAFGRTITANQQHIVGIAKRTSDGKYILMNSNDYGASYSENDLDPIPLTAFYVTQQKYNAEVVYGECSVSFYPVAPSADFISVLYSSDNGVNWIVIQSPVQNTDGLGEQFITLE